jgi:hypothetical protein
VGDEMKVLSFGGGVQTCTMVAMCANGDLPKPDAIIFSDPGWESRLTYEYIKEFEIYMNKHGMKLITTKNGNIRHDLEHKGKRFVSLPLYSHPNGMLRRQCTSEYKIVPVQKKIRELCGMKYRQWMPRNEVHDLWLGISTDEATRMKPSRIKWLKNCYPLIDANMNRQDCLRYLTTRGIPIPPKSACIGCPFHDNHYWKEMKKNRPDEFDDACKVDDMVRTFSVSMKNKTFLHNSRKPLREVNFDDGQQDFFDNECEGHCGL